MLFLEAIVVALLASVCGVTQDIPVIDLTLTEQAIVPDYRLFRSGQGENLTCLKSSARVRVSLEALGATRMSIGDYVDITVRIDNVGESPLNVPTSPLFKDVKPEHAPTTFGYYTLIVPLHAALPSGGNLLSWLVLYGSDSKPDTLLTLVPGRSLRIKGKVRIIRGYSTDQTVTAVTGFGLTRNVLNGNRDTGTRQRRPKRECIEVVPGTTISGVTVGGPDTRR